MHNNVGHVDGRWFLFQRENQTQRRHKFDRFLFLWIFVFVLARVLCVEWSMRQRAHEEFLHFYDSVLIHFI